MARRRLGAGSSVPIVVFEIILKSRNVDLLILYMTTYLTLDHQPIHVIEKKTAHVCHLFFRNNSIKCSKHLTGVISMIGNVLYRLLNTITATDG